MLIWWLAHEGCIPLQSSIISRQIFVSYSAGPRCHWWTCLEYGLNARWCWNKRVLFWLGLHCSRIFLLKALHIFGHLSSMVRLIISLIIQEVNIWYVAGLILFGSQCFPVNTVGAGLFGRCLICMRCHGLPSLAFSVQFSVPYEFPRWDQCTDKKIVTSRFCNVYIQFASTHDFKFAFCIDLAGYQVSRDRGYVPWQFHYFKGKLFPCNVGPACKTAGVCWKVRMIREKMICLLSAWSILLWAAHMDRFLPSYICDLFWWYGVHYVIIFKLLRFMWHCKWYGGFYIYIFHCNIVKRFTCYDAHQLLAGQKSGEFWCTRNFLFQQVCTFTHH